MHKNKWIRGILLCAALAAPLASRAADEHDCRLHRYASLDLVITNKSGVYVPVTIEHQSALMRLNLASAFSDLYEKAAKSLGLHSIKLGYGNATLWVDKKTANEYVESENFALGRVPFKKFQMLIAPDPPASVSTDPYLITPNTVVGALGIDAFQSVDVELDFANHTLKLFSQDHCANKAVYWSDMYASLPLRRDVLGNAYFPMELNGTRLETTLSTAEENTLLRADAARHLFGIDEHSAGVETLQGGMGCPCSQIRMRLSAKGLDVRNAMITLSEPAKAMDCVLFEREGAMGYSECQNIYPLRLGMRVLQMLHIYIATKEKVLYFTAAHAAEAPSSDTGASGAPDDHASSANPAH
jgi:hypothetical protein